MNKIKIIIKREYLTRVSKKSFLVMTILGPILMSLLIFTPFFLSNIEEERLNIMVVDQTLSVNENEFDKTKFKRFDSNLDDAFKISVKNIFTIHICTVICGYTFL